MATTADEIERKHEGAQLRAELLAGLPKVAAVLGPGHQLLDATYYDAGSHAKLPGAEHVFGKQWQPLAKRRTHRWMRS